MKRMVDEKALVESLNDDIIFEANIRFDTEEQKYLLEFDIDEGIDYSQKMDIYYHDNNQDSFYSYVGYIFFISHTPISQDPLIYWTFTDGGELQFYQYDTDDNIYSMGFFETKSYLKIDNNSDAIPNVATDGNITKILIRAKKRNKNIPLNEIDY